MLNGIVILGKACDLIESAERRRDRMESTSESTEKKKSNSSSCGSITTVGSNAKEEPIKVEASTSPIRGWSLPPGVSPITDKPTFKTMTPSPEKTPPASASLVSTPSSTAAPPRSDSLEFFGESKKGLLANSMVNLSSVGINEGPFTGDASKQYRLQHSLESIVSTGSLDVADSSLEPQSSSSLPQTPGVLPAPALPLGDDQTDRVQTITPSPTPPVDKSLSETETPLEMRKFKRPPFLSCDSLRYRGSTDTGDLL